jgi:ubiquinone/menaquinone biosynthesis C-methylase UbiE
MPNSSEKFIFSGLKQDIETAERAAVGKGKALEQLYGGFFGSRKNCELFAQNIPNELYEIKNTTIVDAGSSQGVLGNYIREKLANKGNKAELIMVDTNKVAMEQSPVKANKVVGNLIENPLANESADIVILRSVLQYVETKDQITILEEIYRILKPGGHLVSQFGSFENQEQAVAFNKIFSFAKRNVDFCGEKEGVEMHGKIFDDIIRIANGPTIYETLDEFFMVRINASEDQIKEAKRYISEHTKELGTALTSQADPYSWKIPYTIIACKKAKEIQ